MQVRYKVHHFCEEKGGAVTLEKNGTYLGFAVTAAGIVAVCFDEQGNTDTPRITDVMFKKGQ